MPSLSTDGKRKLPMSGNENFYEAFASHVMQFPRAACLELESGVLLDRLWLDRRSARYANALSALGCMPGDRVAVQVEKSPNALALYLACLRAGLCFLPMNTAYKLSELSYIVSNAEPRALVCKPDQLGVLQPAVADVAVVLTLDEMGEGSLETAAQCAPETFETVYRKAGDIAALLYTSGTTGRPKGAVISHGAMSYCAAVLGQVWGVTSDDVLLHALPMFHGHGLFISSNTALAAGARLIWYRRFDASDVALAMRRSTIFMGVPTYYHRLLAEKKFDAECCTTMRLFTCGSAPLSAELHKEFEQRTRHKIVERYGATETMIISSNPLHGERRPGSVGLPLSGVDLRITDSKDQALGDGEIGLIEVRSPGLFSAYWKLPEQTASEFTADGFFRTGDLGRIAEGGYLVITGRSKDLIISGGYNVYPAEVENVLNEHTKISETAVIGVPHADFGEAVVAVVIAKDPNLPPDAAEVIALAKSRLANFKVPKRVVTVEELPRNTMGKVQKNLLRESFAKLFGGAA
jgi:malonyl-CoA/methylmalonyl-CoA synthetase